MLNPSLLCRSFNLLPKARVISPLSAAAMSTTTNGTHNPPTNSHSNVSKPISTQQANPTYERADQFTKASLIHADLSSDPYTQFHSWYHHAQHQGIPHPETATLSTASLPSGRVSARMVYLKSHPKSPETASEGWVLYSNWGTSRKAADINSNPHAALTFWWQALERQVRVEGRCERLSSEETKPYYESRIRGSRIGAWASRQSSVLSGREELEGQVEAVEKRFEGVGEEIPVPEFWGGLRVIPERVEFWQGRESRLHDRFVYVREEGKAGEGEGGWRIERLSP